MYSGGSVTWYETVTCYILHRCDPGASRAQVETENDGKNSLHDSVKPAPLLI